MQIIEVTDLAVRAAVTTLGRNASPLKFVLFPMIHLGEPGYYKEVTDRLRACDLVVAEGIGPSAATVALMLAYRVTARLGRAKGLVVQNISVGDLGVPVVNPDVTGPEFSAACGGGLPLLIRLAVALLLPVVVLGMIALGTRRVIARQLPLDDLPSQEEVLSKSEAMEEIDAVLVERRDELLVKALVEIHNEQSAEDRRVAVLYGAGHIPGVVRQLGKRFGYFPLQAEWVTAFRL